MPASSGGKACKQCPAVSRSGAYFPYFPGYCDDATALTGTLALHSGIFTSGAFGRVPEQ